MASERQTCNAKWTESVTNIFIGLLVDEVKKGNRTTSTFNKAGWRNIHSEFVRQTGCQYSMIQMRNKVNKLRKLYSSFQKLMSQSGFGWDSVNKRVSVDDPSVWEEHIKENAEWAKFRKDGFPQYPEFCIVFGGTYATGEYGTATAEDGLGSEEDHTGDANVGADNSGYNAYGDNSGGNAYGDAGGGHTDDFGDHHTNERVFTPEDAGTSARGKHKLDRTPTTKRRRRSTQNSIDDACKAIQDYLKVKSSQSGSASATSGVMPSPEDPFSVAAVMDILLTMPEIDQDLYNKAVDRACESASWRVAFIKSTPERRIGLLYHL
ncbi:hypothetical protein EUGRSUZ_L02923 [Eucalyptus grandis]|uniref:Myb/SANT-like domain-containing protein n=1 Tax=Eucalyptus grandis TaxID=71139 RepID=A0AAD9WH49_EUCGR|nr:hypothetical protein EUGRSUZ_L02923 [Eucalyptus grandis]